MKRCVLAALAVGMVAAGCSSRRPVEVLPPAPLPQVAAMREYVVPWENAFPSDVAVDTAGRVWFTDRLTHVIGMLDPATGEFRSFPTPTQPSAPYGLIAAPDGTLWFCESRRGRLGRVDVATGEITEYEIPDAAGGPHLLGWREGVIWFTMREGRAFGRFDTRTGESTVYQLEREQPYSVAITRDAVWLSSYGAFRLLEVDPRTAVVRVHDLQAVVERQDSVWRDMPPSTGVRQTRPRRVWGGEVRRIVSAPDGTIWFTDFARSRVAQYDPAAGSLRFFESVEDRSEPYGLARSTGGHIWYSERGARRMTVLDPSREERRRVPVPGGQSHARHMVLDEQRGRVWLPLSDIGRIGLIEYR